MYIKRRSRAEITLADVPFGAIAVTVIGLVIVEKNIENLTEDVVKLIEDDGRNILLGIHSSLPSSMTIATCITNYTLFLIH